MNARLIYEGAEFGDVISRYEYLMQVYTVAEVMAGYTQTRTPRRKAVASSNGKPLASHCCVPLLDPQLGLYIMGQLMRAFAKRKPASISNPQD